MKTYEALGVANAFIDFANNSSENLTHLKLQKLIYIAYGHYIVEYDCPLIKERIEAWRYGPVIRSVYDEFKSYGRKPIKEYGTILNVTESFNNDRVVLDTPVIEDEKTLEFIENIWRKYGNRDGYDLSNSTHKVDTPWYQAKEKQLDIVPDEFIKSYYKNISDD